MVMILPVSLLKMAAEHSIHRCVGHAIRQGPKSQEQMPEPQNLVSVRPTAGCGRPQSKSAQAAAAGQD